MKIGKFKKLLVSILVLSLGFGMMNAPRVVNAEGDNEAIQLSKKAFYDKTDQKYKIQLEAYTTGSVSTENPVPADIVLVLDQSGSMTGSFGDPYEKYESVSFEWNDYIFDVSNNEYYVKVNNNYFPVMVRTSGNWSNRKYTLYYEVDGNEKTIVENVNYNYQLSDISDHTFYESKWTQDKKIDALKEAVTNFVDAVAEDAEENEVDHRIAMVGFASNNTDRLNYGNTELFNGYGNTKNYRDLQSSDYKNAFQYVNTSQGINNINSWINKLEAEGGTAINLGMEMAENVLSNNVTEDETRQKIVIVFTDGIPGIYDTDDDEKRTSYANAAISNAYNVKNKYGATVYTIGVFNGSDNSNPSGSGIYSTPTNWSNSTTFNWFLHTLSSDYKNAQAMNNRGSLAEGVKNGTTSHYMPANDSDSLNNVFVKISEEMGSPTIQLGSDTVIKDTISDYFKLPDGYQTSDVDLYTSQYLGNNQWDDKKEVSNGLTVNFDGKSVTVSGYDFDTNYVYENEDHTQHGGQKLIIIFEIKPIDKFIGGNAVPTNTEDSGLFINGNTTTPLKRFDIPYVDVAINYSFETQDNAMYIRDTLDGSDFEKFIKTNYLSITDDFINDFVTIQYTVSNKTDNTTIGTYTIDPGEKVGQWDWYDKQNKVDSSEYLQTKDIMVRVDVTPKKDPIMTDGVDGTNYTPGKNVSNPTENNKLYILVPTISSSDDEIFLGNSANLNSQMSVVNQWNVLNESNVSYVNTLGSKPEIGYTITSANDELSNQIEENIFTPETVGTFEFKYTVQANNKDITDYVTTNHSNTYGNCDDNCGEEHFYIKVVGGTISFKKIIDTMENYPIKEDGIFVYKITNNKTQNVYYRIVRAHYNKSSKSFTYNEIDDLINLPAGSYTVEELSSMRFTCDGYKLDSNREYINESSVTFEIDKENHRVQVSFKNSLTYDDNLSDGDVVVNSFKKNDDGSISITQDWLNGKKIVNGVEEGGQ